MTPQDFIASVSGGAQQFQRTSNVFASVTLAQAALETGWGAFVPVDYQSGKKSYNLFGVKGDGTNGHVTAYTWEVENGQRVNVLADFRAYNSFAESIADHAQVLMNDRYAPVRNAQTPEEAANLLHSCGYATDPDYGTKLISIISTYNLKQYDLPKVTPPTLDATVANAVIARWVGYEYAQASHDDQLFRAYVADALRVASGQEPHNTAFLNGWKPSL